jgi:preprotein translocase subunit SecE
LGVPRWLFDGIKWSMKKKKARRKKSARKRSHSVSATSSSRPLGAEAEAIPQREELEPALARRDVVKRADTGGFAPKRYFNVVRQFITEAKIELKKVTWPTRKELLTTTAVVLILVLLVAFFLGVVDLGLVKIIRNVIG